MRREERPEPKEHGCLVSGEKFPSGVVLTPLAVWIFHSFSRKRTASRGALSALARRSKHTLTGADFSAAWRSCGTQAGTWAGAWHHTGTQDFVWDGSTEQRGS